MTTPKHILIVNDEPRMRRFVRMNLELEQFQVSEASDGLEAIRKVRDEMPDLVVLDVKMPSSMDRDPARDPPHRGGARNHANRPR